MSFSLERRTLRSGNLFNLKACARVSALEEQPKEASESHKTKQGDDDDTEFSPNLIGEKRKANPEPPHAQNTTRMQTMNKLIHENSATINSTVGSRNSRFQSEFSLTDGPGTPRILPLASVVTAGYSPNNEPQRH